VQRALETQDVDRLEYLIEFIKIGPIEDQFADPIRYRMLSIGIENMRAEGVVNAIENLLKNHPGHHDSGSP
jgi:hypothetical protein